MAFQPVPMNPSQMWRGSQPDGQARPSYQKNSSGFYTGSWVTPPVPSLGMPVLSPTLQVKGVSSDGTNVQIQMQSASDVSFTSPTTTTLTGQTSGATVSFTGLGPFTNLTTVYFRFRVGDGTNWSQWYADRKITFDTALGNAHQYAFENVGVTLTALQDNHAYGFENVGVESVALRDNHAYAYEGDVNTDHPTPHIWFVFPTSGRGGDGIGIYGHGFGALQATYSGVIQVDLGDGTWITATVTNWQLVAASAHAYDALRTMDPSIPLCDPEHNLIEIVIPSTAVPPIMLVRGVTT